MTRRKQPSHAWVVIALASFSLGAALAGGACSEDLPSDQTSSTTSSGGGGVVSTSSSSGGTGGKMGTGGMGTGGMGTGGAPDCFTNPMTHIEIINACTDAQRIDVSPSLPLLEADGGLPPLP